MLAICSNNERLKINYYIINNKFRFITDKRSDLRLKNHTMSN